MKITSVIYAVAVFGLFMGVSFMVFFDGANKYGVTYSSENYSKAYNMINESLKLSSDAGSKISNSSTDQQNSLESLGKNTYSALRYTTSSLKYANTIVGQIQQELKIPRVFYDVFVIVLMVGIIFALIYIFTGLIK